MNRIVKRSLKIGGYVLLTVVGILLVGIGWLYVHSDGTTAPIVDEKGQPVPGSIASLERIELNGAKQWILIRGYDQTKPVLLIVHGGPGSPEMPMLTNNDALEKRFVVVNWDQRGAGKSYDPAVFDRTFTLGTFIEDAAQLSRLLAKRFNQPKIYLLGHSWGTFLGVQTVQKYPDLFHAYFGIGQVANQLLGEQLSYDWVLQQAKQHRNDKQLTFLKRYGRPPYASNQTWIDYLLPQRNMVSAYGGAIHTGSLNTLLIDGLLLCKEYTLRDKINYMTGALETIKRLWPTLVSTNLNHTTPQLNVPVYVFQGVYDYQTPYAVAKSYFDQLQAPRKQFFTFNKSAHGPIFEEPALFMKHLDEAVQETEGQTKSVAAIGHHAFR